VRCVDWTGYIASALVFLTFYMRGMIQLRLLAICSNVAFLIYAYNLRLLPIVILHSALIPVNAYRLVTANRDDVQRKDDARYGKSIATALIARALSRAVDVTQSRFGR